MAFYSNGERILNLPEQVEKNAEDIADLNQKSEYADTNITNLQSQTASNATKISTLENNTTSANGTITTGTLDVKNNATFGKVIVNSADDITDKDGNAIVKNESLEEFKRNYYATAGKFRFAGLKINAYEGENSNIIVDPESTKWTDLTQQYAFSGFYSFGKLVTDPVQFPDFATTGPIEAYGIIDGFENDQVVFGNARIYGARLFENYQGKSIMVKEGKTFKLYDSAAACFNYDSNLEEIGAFDFSEVSHLDRSTFASCRSLKHIHIKHFKDSFDISFSTSFEQSDLIEIISNLDPVSTPKTLTMGATNLAKLTQDQILVANEKGWTLA